MKKTQCVSLSILTAFLLSACQSTSLKSTKIKPDDHAEGWVYYLPERALTIDMQVVLTSCRILGTPDSFTVELSTDLTADISSSVYADTKNTFVLSHQDDSTKKIDTTVKLYPNGTLQSINSDVEDRTLEITGNFIKTGLTIAGAVSGVPTSYKSSFTNEETKKKTTLSCAENIEQSINEYNKALQDLITETAKVMDNKKSKDYQTYITYSARMKVLKEQQKKVSTKIDETRANGGSKIEENHGKDLEKINSDISKLSTKIQNTSHYILLSAQSLASKNLEEKKDNISKSKRIVWTPQKGDLNKELPITFEIPVKISNQDDQVIALVTSPLAEISVSHHSYADFFTSSDLPDNFAVNGILYRQPVPMTVDICNVDCTDNAKPIASKTITFPQFGTLAYLPVNSETGSDTVLSASFGADGVLVESTYKSEARLEKLSGMLLNTANDFKTYHDTRRANKFTELDGIKQETEKYKAMKELEDAKNAYKLSLEN